MKIVMIILSLVPIILCGWEAVYYIKEDNFAMLPIVVIGLSIGLGALALAIGSLNPYHDVKPNVTSSD